jgi:hypothetical protein
MKLTKKQQLKNSVAFKEISPDIRCIPRKINFEKFKNVMPSCQDSGTRIKLVLVLDLDLESQNRSAQELRNLH